MHAYNWSMGVVGTTFQKVKDFLFVKHKNDELMCFNAFLYQCMESFMLLFITHMQS